MMTVVWEKLKILLGRAPSCDWVQLRLAAYEAWDLSLTVREFTVIHDHVHECPVCAVEYEQTAEIVSLLRAASGRVPPPEIDPEAIADRVLAEISSRELDRERKVSPGKRPLRFKLAAALALCAIVLIAVPVLAYVGQEVWQALSDSGDSELASTDTSESQAPSDGQSTPDNPTGADAPETTDTF